MLPLCSPCKVSLAELHGNQARLLLCSLGCFLVSRLQPLTGTSPMAALQRNVGLRSLLLGWNQLAAQGGLDMAGALRESGGVQHLCLAWTSLGEGACLQVADAVLRSEGLQAVDLSGNLLARWAS